MAHSELLANHMLCSLYMQPLLAPAVTVRRRELWILPPFCFLPLLLPITLQENKLG